MCFPCYGFSLLTLVMPGTPQPDLQAVKEPTIEYNQVNASEATTSIKKLLDRLPNSPELSLLRSELKSLQAKLALVKNNAEANKVFKDGLQLIDQRIAKQPNSKVIVEALLDVVEDSDSEQLVKSISLKNIIQSRSITKFDLKGKSNRCGWLR